MHALIIEPQILTAFMIEDALRSIGFTSFAFATTEADAVAAAEARCPDLITAAVQLASGCGIDAVQEICRERAIAVVFITQNLKEVRRRAPRVAVVRKPFGVANLQAAIVATRAGGASPAAQA